MTDLQNLADAVADDIANRISKKLESFLPSTTMDEDGPEVAELQRRLSWVLLRCEDARDNFHKGLLRRGCEQEDFNGFLSGIERIADGGTAKLYDSYPPLCPEQD